MTIIDKIKSTIEPIVGTGRFHYADSGDLNMILDNATFPCAFATLMSAGTVTDQAGLIHENAKVAVWFANLSQEGISGTANEELLQPLKENAFKWIQALQHSDYFTLQSVNSTNRYYLNNSQMDVLLTAFVVDVTIIEKEGFGVCGK